MGSVKWELLVVIGMVPADVVLKKTKLIQEGKEPLKYVMSGWASADTLVVHFWRPSSSCRQDVSVVGAKRSFHASRSSLEAGNGLSTKKLEGDFIQLKAFLGSSCITSDKKDFFTATEIVFLLDCFSSGSVLKEKLFNEKMAEDSSQASSTVDSSC